MAIPLQPAPIRVPFLNAKGEIVEEWRRFFLATQTNINQILFALVRTGAPSAQFPMDDASDVEQPWPSAGSIPLPGPKGDKGETGTVIGLLDPDGGSSLDDLLWYPPGPPVIGSVGSGATIQSFGRATAQTAAVTSVLTFNGWSNDASFIVSANVLVTTSTAHTFTVTCAYTDESNTARTLTLTFSQLAGTFITAITNVTGAGPYEGVPLQIRCLAATTITIATTGTFTTVTYNVEAVLLQVA